MSYVNDRCFMRSTILFLKPLVVICATGCLLSCFECPPAPLELPSAPLNAGEQVALSARVDGRVIGGEGCEGFWYVNDTLGGSVDEGLIDDCGRYTAPTIIDEPTTVEIIGSPYILGVTPDEEQRASCEERECVVCVDCCPYARGHLSISPA